MDDELRFQVSIQTPDIVVCSRIRIVIFHFSKYQWMRIEMEDGIDLRYIDLHMKKGYTK